MADLSENSFHMKSHNYFVLVKLAVHHKYLGFSVF